jgi:hypothetical protein
MTSGIPALRLALIWMLALHLGCSAIAVQQSKGTVAPVPFYSKVAFDTVRSVIVLEADVDGQPGKLILDTGADLSVIQRDSLRGNTGQYRGASGRKMQLGLETVPSIRIGEVSFLNTAALNGDLAGLKEQIPGFAGLIGQSVLQKANWLINYPALSLEISDRDLSDESFTAIETIFSRDHNPYTYIELYGRQYRVLIDLGSASELNIPEDSPMARDLAAKVQLSANQRTRYTLGGLEVITEQIGVIPAARIGSCEFTDVSFNINASSQPRVGSALFRDYLIYLDHTNQVCKLKKADGAAR